MEKESKRALRRVRLTNRFDRLCNFVLIRIFPLSQDQDTKIINCRAALDYAHEDLQKEKEMLKQVRKMIIERGKAREAIIALNAIEANQYRRHSEMHEIIEGKKVR